MSRAMRVSLLSGELLETQASGEEMQQLRTARDLKELLARADPRHTPVVCMKLIHGESELIDDAPIPWERAPLLIAQTDSAEVDLGLGHDFELPRNPPLNIKSLVCKHCCGVKFRENGWPNVNGADCPPGWLLRCSDVLGMRKWNKKSDRGDSREQF